MLLTARILVRIVCVVEFIFAFIAFIASFMGDGTQQEASIIGLIGLGLVIHGISGLVVASFMTWYISAKQIIFLILSGILLLCANLIEGVYINPTVGFLYIFAGIISVLYNLKAQQDEGEEKARQDKLNNEMNE
ncbi:hypothetical protein HCA78_17260 [Listeria booriae]|uniref:Uncharacterized protein n=1 Tax=Listeria booriae TaxID=1552123 RepID=A0A842D3A0_9LIST|nr:hypothetical protein [Listeria booriae]MBC2005520.1 hypothetical protein [Listeria booriae]